MRAFSKARYFFKTCYSKAISLHCKESQQELTDASPDGAVCTAAKALNGGAAIHQT